MLPRRRNPGVGRDIAEIIILFSVAVSCLLTDTEAEEPCSFDIMRNGSIFPVVPQNCFLERQDPYRDYKGPGSGTVKIIPPPFRAVFIGCYEIVHSRHNETNLWRSDNMTLLNCLVYCSLQMSSYVGLWSGKTCHCNHFPFILVRPTRKEHRHCLFPCRGNTRFACGGKDTVILYKLLVTDYVHGRKRLKKHGLSNSLLAQPRSASSSFGKSLLNETRLRQSPVWPKDAPGNYLGCFVAGTSKGNQRTLKMKTFPKMTIEDCTMFCRSIGIRYVAIYRDDCHCGADPLPRHKVFDFLCNLECLSSVRKQFCGGQRWDIDKEKGSANSKIPTKIKRVYLQEYRLNNPPGFDSFQAIFIGCYKNNPFKSDTVSIYKFEYVSVNMSVDICVGMCQHRRHRFSLISIPKNMRRGDFLCHCATAYFVQRRPSNIADCKTKCPSDSRQFCGGTEPDAYQLHAAVPLRGRFSNYGTFWGCYSSLPSGRPSRMQIGLADTNRSEAKQVNTDRCYLDKCVKECRKRDFQIIALTSGTICTCVKPDVSEPLRMGDRIGESKCNIPCGDECGDYCGGENAFQIYSAKIPERVIY